MIKKILFIHNTAELGGASTSLLDIISALDRDRFEPIIMLPKEGRFTQQLREKGIRMYVRLFSTLPFHEHVRIDLSFSSAKRLLRFLMLLPLTLWNMGWLLKREQIDLVYLNTSVMIACAILPKLWGIPIITHIREIPYRYAFGDMLLRLHRLVSKEILCNSVETKRQVERVISNCIVAYDWVDLDKFYPRSVESAKAALGLPLDRVCIGFANQLITAKGIFVFLETALQLLRKGYDCTFLVVGGFTHKPEEIRFWQAVRGEGYESRFICTGWVRNMPDYLAAMDVVVSPNILPEGFGKTIIEAQAMERALVASDIGPTRDLVVDQVTAFLVEPENSFKLADAIEILINEPARREQMGLEGRRFVGERFIMELRVQTILSVIEGVGCSDT